MIIWVVKIFLYSSVYSCHLYLSSKLMRVTQGPPESNAADWDSSFPGLVLGTPGDVCARATGHHLLRAAGSQSLVSALGPQPQGELLATWGIAEVCSPLFCCLSWHLCWLSPGPGA